MLDALLYAVRDNIRSVLGYDARTCEIRDDGHPPPRCGDWFAAVHQMRSRSEMVNALDEYFGFSVTLTARVTNVPLDRVGDRLLAKQLAETTGFNAKADVLRAFLHMAWGVIQDANNNILARPTVLNQVYGFATPAYFNGMEIPVLVGGEWFWAMEDAGDMGIKAQMDFEGARRLQPIATYV